MRQRIADRAVQRTAQHAFFFARDALRVGREPLGAIGNRERDRTAVPHRGIHTLGDRVVHALNNAGRHRQAGHHPQAVEGLAGDRLVHLLHA